MILTLWKFLQEQALDSYGTIKVILLPIIMLLPEGIHILFPSIKMVSNTKAKLVGAEPKKDIAVLKLEEMPKELTPVIVGESQNLLVGQKALAIGNPLA